MKEINVGKVIAKLRKEREITQEDLANYLGVSKPAVSKWESAQSYPDITLLPEIATYFDVTIDELLGYEPQMSKAEIRRQYARLAEIFAKEGFEPGYRLCQFYIKKYYSCWPLVFNLGVLILNSAMGLENEERKREVFIDLVELYKRVEHNSEDKNIAKQAIHLRATCYLELNMPTEVIDLLGEMIEMPMSTDVLLATAYKMKGNQEEAVGLFQGYLYTNVLNTLTGLGGVMELEAGDGEKLGSWIMAVEAVIDAFDMKTLHPSTVASMYINIAYMCAMIHKKETALEYITKYTDLVCSEQMFPLRLKGNYLFDHLEKHFDKLDLGTQVPRNEEAVKESMKEALNMPMWDSIRKSSKFKLCEKRLENI